MTNDPKLRRWYLTMNKKWFGGTLPTETVTLWWEPLGKPAAETSEILPAHEGDPAELVIKVDPMLFGLARHARRDLLHLSLIHI